jgi:polyketide cyclase/dehydrase/lipid transport protein
VRVEMETVLPTTRDRAWSVVTDWERQPEWMRDADSVRVLTPSREGVGVRIAVKTRVLGVPLLTEILEVVEWRPPEYLAVRHAGFVRGVGEWRFDRDVEGTRYRWIEDLSLPVPVISELALLIYRPFMRRLMRFAMDDLRRSLATAA